uniref:Apple domain-containing protein n=1 Tax=Panagrolaimus sp. PS1159 TaxID=55785 RepID=A0AC35EZL1_9BILA
MLDKTMGEEIILSTTIPVTKPKPPPPQNPTKPTNSSIKLPSSSTNPAIAKELKLGGFFFLSKAECQKLCNQNLLKCVAYLYEQKNRGKCTLFQNFVDEKVTKSPNSTAVISKKN